MVLSGNLTADPELRYTGTGTAVASLRIAHSIGREDEPLFINVTAWEKLAEACAERLRKGNKIVAHGSLKPESWTAADGTKRSAISVRAISIEFMAATQAAPVEEGDTPRAVTASEHVLTELPF